LGSPLGGGGQKNIGTPDFWALRRGVSEDSLQGGGSRGITRIGV